MGLQRAMPSRRTIRAMTEVRLGLCGFTIGFEDYVREFPVVEVQQTFYEPPRDGTMRGGAPRPPTTSSSRSRPGS